MDVVDLLRSSVDWVERYSSMLQCDNVVVVEECDCVMLSENPEVCGVIGLPKRTIAVVAAVEGQEFANQLVEFPSVVVMVALAGHAQIFDVQAQLYDQYPALERSQLANIFGFVDFHHLEKLSLLLR